MSKASRRRSPGSRDERRATIAAKQAAVEEFLLPSVDEVEGIMSPGWIKPPSLRAKDAIRHLLGDEVAP